MMLSQLRQEAGLYPAAPFTIDTDDVDQFMKDLKQFHGSFAGCFVRSEPRAVSGCVKMLKKGGFKMLVISGVLMEEAAGCARNFWYRRHRNG